MKMTNLSSSICAAVAVLALNAQASLTVGEGSFTPLLQPGYFNATFAGNNSYGGGYSFSSGGFSGDIKPNSTGNNMFASGGVLGAFDSPLSTITFNNFAGGVSAVGANFFLTDINAGSYPGGLAGTISVTANYSGPPSPDSQNNYVLSAGETPFWGFTAPAGQTIDSIVFVGQSASLFSTLDNLYVGAAAVPEPSFWGFCVGSGLVVFGAYRRMRK